MLQVRDSNANDSSVSVEILHGIRGSFFPGRGPNAVVSVVTVGRGVLLPWPVGRLMFGVGWRTQRHALGECVCVSVSLFVLFTTLQTKLTHTHTHTHTHATVLTILICVFTLHAFG